MPRAATQQALDLRDQQGDEEIGDKKRHRPVGHPGRRFLERGEQRKQDKNRSRNDNLPVEVVAVGLLRVHARDASVLST